MGIDQARIAQHTGAVNDFLRRRRKIWSHGPDDAVGAENVDAVELPVCAVTGDSGADVLQ